MEKISSLSLRQQ